MSGAKCVRTRRVETEQERRATNAALLASSQQQRERQRARREALKLEWRQHLRSAGGWFDEVLLEDFPAGSTADLAMEAAEAAADCQRAERDIEAVRRRCVAERIRIEARREFSALEVSDAARAGQSLGSGRQIRGAVADLGEEARSSQVSAPPTGVGVPDPDRRVERVVGILSRASGPLDSAASEEAISTAAAAADRIAFDSALERARNLVMAADAAAEEREQERRRAEDLLHQLGSAGGERSMALSAALLQVIGGAQRMTQELERSVADEVDAETAERIKDALQAIGAVAVVNDDGRIVGYLPYRNGAVKVMARHDELLIVPVAFEPLANEEAVAFDSATCDLKDALSSELATRGVLAEVVSAVGVGIVPPRVERPDGALALTLATGSDATRAVASQPSDAGGSEGTTVESTPAVEALAISRSSKRKAHAGDSSVRRQARRKPTAQERRQL